MCFFLAYTIKRSTHNDNYSSQTVISFYTGEFSKVRLKILQYRKLAEPCPLSDAGLVGDFKFFLHQTSLRYLGHISHV